MGCEVSTSKHTAQGVKIVQYMKRHGCITALEAQQEFGCARLAARINDLRKLGFAITSTPVVFLNRDWVKTRIAQYSLEE